MHIHKMFNAHACLLGLILALGILGVACGGSGGGSPASSSTSTSTATTAEEVYPATYGAVGDGVTDDTIALRQTVAAAGVNGVVTFPTAKTYRITGSISLLQGQTINGNGSIIKRCDVISTTTATAITAGQTSVALTLADASRFKVGMDITVFSGTGWQSGTDFDTTTHRILSLSGSVATVGTAFRKSFPSGGTVATAFSCFTMNLSGVQGPRIYGLEFNGNRANNALIARWELNNEVYLNGNEALLQGCYLHDCQSEGVQFGGIGSAVLNCRVENCGGNGIHFSGSSGATAQGNTVKNCNLLGTYTGHSDGAIIFSNSTADSYILDNTIDTALSGVGSIDSDDNSSVTIQGNIIRNCTYSAIEGELPSGLTAGKVVVTGNHIYSSKLIKLSYAPGTYVSGCGPYEWVIQGNYLSETYLAIRGANTISVTGNEFVSTTKTQSHVVITESKNVTVEDNTFKGGYEAVSCTGSANLSNILISGNQCINQYARGIQIGYDLVSNGVTIQSNSVTVESTSTTNGAFVGIRARNATYVLNNTLNISTTSTDYGIHGATGASGVNGAVIDGNIVRTVGMAGSIGLDSGSINNIVTDNYVVQAIVNGGTNTLSGNIIIN